MNAILQNGFRNCPMERRAAPIEAVDINTRTATVVWTAGASVERRDFWTGERYLEELVVSDKAVRMTRLNAGAPLLNSHNAWGLGGMLGVVERAWIEKGRGLAEVRFPQAEDSPDADKVLRMVRDKIIRNVSVGYSRLRIEVDRKNDPVVYRVVDWEPFEISLVSVPADPEAQVRAAESMAACEFVVPTDQGLNTAVRARMTMRARQSGLIR